jgi:uncharacterized protein YcfJ
MRALLSIMLGGLLTLTGCTTIPLGPSVAVMPAPSKPFDLFVAEENVCRQYAAQHVGKTPSQPAGESVATGAATGTVLGAATGAALGALSGRPALGAAAGAGTGLLLGTAAGSNAGYASSWVLQSRYDIAYQQCMYAHGNQVPGFAWPSTPAPPPPPPAGLPPSAG